MRSSKIQLRKVLRTDLKYFRDWRNSTEIWKNNTQFTFLNMKDQNRWFNSLFEKDSKKDMFTIIDSKKKPVGICGLTNLDTNEKSGKVAIIIGDASLQSKGVGTQGLELLLDYGFRYFRTKKILSKDLSVITEQVWGGQDEQVNLSSREDFYLTLSPLDFQRIEPKITLNDYLQAPIVKGQVVGKIDLLLDGESLATVDAISMEEVSSLGFFGRAWSNIKLLTYKFLIEE